MNNVEEFLIKKEKSRNLGIFEFFKILQMEALCAELRSKIYPRTKDKNFWKKVYEYKKKTIFDIAERNKVDGISLPSIFTEEGILEEYKKEIFGEGGYPNFLYKDKENENLQSHYDSEYYYSKGVDVACKYLDEVKIGKVSFYQANSRKVTVSLGQEQIELNIEHVTRII